MKNLKRLVVLGAVVLAVGATSITAFAASTYGTTAEIAAQVTGRTVDQVTEEKLQNGVTYGVVAKNYDSLVEFQAAMLENKIAILKERVIEGTLTQEKADEIITALKENQATCDGTGQAKIGQNYGAGFGGMTGNGSGQGQGQGLGREQNGNGLRNGLGLRDSSCLAQ